MIGLVGVGIAAFIGMTIGLIAGYFGGWVHAVIMRFIDALMAFPLILLALILAALLGGGLKNVMIALGVGLLPAYARLMCGQVLSVKENDYVLAGRAMGADNIRIMFRHVLPNCFPPLIVLITMMIGLTILLEAGLSFLGIGIEPPGAAWGAMVSDGYQYLLTHPILSFAPGFAIMLVVFAFNVYLIILMLLTSWIFSGLLSIMPEIISFASNPLLANSSAQAIITISIPTIGIIIF